MTLRNFNNSTTVGSLTAPIASSATSITVSGLSGAPAVPFTVTVDRNTATEEICLVTASAGGTLTVTRGFDGTAAQAHAAGAAVEHTAGAIEYQEANAHVNATTNVHGATGSLVSTSGTQTIFNKTLISPVSQADATLGDAVVAYVPSAASSKNLFRGMGTAGTDVITIDAGGNVNAQTLASVGATNVHGVLTVTGTSTLTGATTITGAAALNGGATVPAGKTLTVAGTATLSGNATVAGTLGVTGASTVAALTASGTVSANNGITVPTGKTIAGDVITASKVTISGTPSASTDAVPWAYVQTYYATSTGGGAITTAAAAATAPCSVSVPGAGTWNVDYSSFLSLSTSTTSRTFTISVFDGTTDALTSSFADNTAGGISSMDWSSFGQITTTGAATFTVRVKADGTGGTQAIGAQKIRVQRAS